MHVHVGGERLEAVLHRHGLQHHWRTLDMEYGGMNDVLWRLAALSGRADHRRWASLFDKPCFLAPLGLRHDSLTRMHGNTHVRRSPIEPIPSRRLASPSHRLRLALASL